MKILWGYLNAISSGNACSLLALKVLVPLAHSGALWIYSADSKSCRSSGHLLEEGIFRAMYLSRLTDGQDNENAIGLFAECWYNLQQSQNFFWKKVMLIEKHIRWVVLIPFSFFDWRQIYSFKCTNDFGTSDTPNTESAF